MLAHSLRDAGTTKKLAVLVTLDGVTADAIVQLKVRYPFPPAKLSSSPFLCICVHAPKLAQDQCC